MQWRMAMERHKNKEGAQEAQDFEAENAGQPRALRALNLISKNMGLSTIYKDTIAQPGQKQPSKEIYYIKPGFVDRAYDRAWREPDYLPVVNRLNQIPATERCAISITRLQGLLYDQTADNIVMRSILLQDRNDKALEQFKRMKLASHDGIDRTKLQEEETAMQKAAYNDNEEAMDVDAYVSQIIENYFDDDPENDTAPDDLTVIGAHYKYTM